MLDGITSLFDGELPEFVGFDLDGTLVDSVPDITLAVDRMLVAMEMIPAGEWKVRSWVGNGAAKLVQRALADALDEVEENLNADFFQQGMEHFQHFYGEVNGQFSQLYPGVSEVLEALSVAQVPMAIITNKPKHFADPLLEHLDIAGYFELVVGGECLPQKKPDPMPLLHCCDFFQVEPTRCLMIGDSRSDIEAAKAAGFRSVAMTYGYNHDEPVANTDPDWLVSDFRELLL